MVIEEILVIDIETSGLSHEYSIVEIGICKLNLEKGTINPFFNLVCKEEADKYLDQYAWVFQNSDLTYEEVKNAPYLSKFQNIIQEIFNLGYECTAFNQSFDFGFLEDRGFKIPHKFWDAMLVLKEIMKIPHSKYGYKFPKVQEAYDYLFGNEVFLEGEDKYKEKHRALDDAIHESMIFYGTYNLLKKKVI